MIRTFCYLPYGAAAGAFPLPVNIAVHSPGGATMWVVFVISFRFVLIRWIINFMLAICSAIIEKVSPAVMHQDTEAKAYVWASCGGKRPFSDQGQGDLAGQTIRPIH